MGVDSLSFTRTRYGVISLSDFEQEREGLAPLEIVK